VSWLKSFRWSVGVVEIKIPAETAPRPAWVRLSYASVLTVSGAKPDNFQGYHQHLLSLTETVAQHKSSSGYSGLGPLTRTNGPATYSPWKVTNVGYTALPRTSSISIGLSNEPHMYLSSKCAIQLHLSNLIVSHGPEKHPTIALEHGGIAYQFK
jgi:hypothetical protein